MEQTNDTTLAATLECLDGIVLSLVFDGDEVAPSWGVRTASDGLVRISQEATRRGRDVVVTALGDPLPPDAPLHPADGRLIATPGGSWLPAPPPPHSTPAPEEPKPNATLTHRLAHGVPPESGDLFDIDSNEFRIPAAPTETSEPDPTPQAPHADTSSHPVPGHQATQAGQSGLSPTGMSRGELDEWVAQELLNPEKASSGAGTIRTRANIGPTNRQRAAAVVGLIIVGLLGVIGGGSILFGGGSTDSGSRSHDLPVAGPFDIKPAILTPQSGNGPNRLPGYRKAWQIRPGQGASIAVTRYAVVRAKGRSLILSDTATGKALTSVHAYGQVKTIVSGKTVDDNGHQTRVMAWQYRNTLNVQILDRSKGRLPQPVRLRLPPDATVSARLDGILITDRSDTSRVGLLVRKPDATGKAKGGKAGKKGAKKSKPRSARPRFAIRWLDAPQAKATSEKGRTDGSNSPHASDEPARAATAAPPTGRRWAYAATPEGQVWWLYNDGTAILPTAGSRQPTTLVAGQPQSGTAFAGWLGAGFGADTLTEKTPDADSLVGVWRDPVDSTLTLATYKAADAKSGATLAPVAAVTVEADVASDGTTGISSSHLGIGTWLIDATSSRIVASGTKHTLRVGGVYGEVAEIADRNGRLRFVPLSTVARTTAQQATPSPSASSSASERTTSDSPADEQTSSGPASDHGSQDANMVRTGHHSGVAADDPTPSRTDSSSPALPQIQIPRSPYDILGVGADGTIVVRDGSTILGLRPSTATSKGNQAGGQGQ